MTVKDQTRPEWIALPKTDKGTAFLIFELQDGGLEPRYIRDVTYSECKHLGLGSFAFKWIPNSVESFESIRNTVCFPVKCSGIECAQTGCICSNGHCMNGQERVQSQGRVHPGLTGGRKRKPELVH